MRVEWTKNGALLIGTKAIASMTNEELETCIPLISDGMEKHFVIKELNDRLKSEKSRGSSCPVPSFMRPPHRFIEGVHYGRWTNAKALRAASNLSAKLRVDKAVHNISRALEIVFPSSTSK